MLITFLSDVKTAVSGRAKIKTAALTKRQNARTEIALVLIPLLILAYCFAPWFWATNVEKAFPKSWTGE